MTTLTVFRHPPPPIIGVCGVVFDRAFEAFEQNSIGSKQPESSSNGSTPRNNPRKPRASQP